MAGKWVEKDTMTQIAQQRMHVLEMAEMLGNVSEACYRGGMDRTSFYKWKRRYHKYGLKGLNNMPHNPKTQPNRTPPETEAAILECSLAHPSWGCAKLSNFFKAQGQSISASTVQKILIRNNMAKVYDRRRKIEEQHQKRATS